MLLLVYRALNGLAPQYISDMLSVYNASRSLRSQGGSLLHVPRAFSKSGEIAFMYLKDGTVCLQILDLLQHCVFLKEN